MKRIIYTFLMGLFCIAIAKGQPYNQVLNLPESGTQLHQATNSITFNPGYSYTPNGGNLIANIVSPITSHPHIINLGSFSNDFVRTDTQNTALFTNNYEGNTTKDVAYQFTLTQSMELLISHCGSELEDTYMALLDASGNLIKENNDYEGDGDCDNGSQAYIRKILVPGIYYLVAEGGYLEDGVITTTFTGYYYNNEFNYSEIPSSYSSDPRGVGAIGGSFAVSATGGATYSIPIEVPVGVGSMQPSLSITYNSQSGNGVAGMGTSLSGISAITRVPRDIYHDTIARGITYLKHDALMLNGQRLIYSSGTIGQEGTVYYPESDPFTKVTFHGSYTPTGCDAWFEVLDKNGMKYYYGANVSSRQTYNTGSVDRVNAWFLEYMEDPLGNYLQYEYMKSSYYLYLSAIEYGKNKNITTTLSNRVEFTYEIRTDLMPFVMEGIKGVMDKRLKKIISKTGTSVFREYILDYSNSDHFSRLVSVTEKNGAGEELKPTQLTWNTLPAFSQKCYEVSVEPAHSYKVTFADQFYQSADMNGDGITDIISVFPTTDQPQGGIQNRTKATIYTGSISVDGKLTFTPGFAYEIGGQSFPTAEWISENSGCVAVDFDGDGSKELLIPNTYTNFPGIRVTFSFIEGNMHGKYFDYDLKCSDKTPLYTIADFNNDGKDEVFYLEKGQSNNLYPGEIVGYNGAAFYRESINLNLSNSPLSNIPKKNICFRL